MNDEDRKKLADCISTLLLSDHMGDAHEAGIVLSEMLWGKSGRREYMQSVDDGRATSEMRHMLAVFAPEIWRDVE